MRSALFFAFLLCITTSTYAQSKQDMTPDASEGISQRVPLGFPMQGIAVSPDGVVMAEQSLTIRVAVSQGSSSGQALYQEDHTIETTPQGVFQLVVGRGDLVPGSRNSFEEIDWSQGTYWLSYYVDMTQSGVYEAMGSTELLSVPYAMVASSSLDGGRVDTIYIPHPVDELVHENDSSVVTIGRVTTQGVMVMGQLTAGSLTFPVADSGVAGQVLTTDGNGTLQFASPGLASLAEDVLPVLGGELNTAGNAIVSSVREDIEITPGGAANVVISGIRFPNKDGYPNQYLATDGRGNLTFRNLQDKKGLSSVSADSEPSLGGNLNTNGRSIVSGEGQDITLQPGAGARVVLSGLSFPTSDGSGGQVLSTDGNGQLRFVNSDGSSQVVSNQFIYDRTNFEESIMIGDTSISGTLSSAENNIGIGSTTFEDLTTGGYNIAIGANMLTNLTTGLGNVFIGQTLNQKNTPSETENALTTGSLNIALGAGALETIDTEGNNVGIGYGAGFGATTGSRNVFIGSSAGFGSTMDKDSRFAPNGGNVVIGLNAAISAKDGISESVVLGARASGEESSVIAIGEEASGSGLYSVGIGFQASASGEGSVALGYKASAQSDNTIALGGATLDSVITVANLRLGALTYPNEDGTAGQILATDGFGTLEFIDVASDSSSLKGFSAGGTTVSATSTDSVINFGTTGIVTASVSNDSLIIGSTIQSLSTELELRTGGVIGIKTSGVTSSMIADGAITMSKIDDGAITSANVVDGSLDSTDIASASIGVNRLFVPGDVTTGQALVVDGTKLVFDDIEGTTYSAGSGLTLTGTTFSVDTIGTSSIADGAVTTVKIADDAVTTAKIQDASITGAKLATGTITGANIADGAIDSTNIASASIGVNRLFVPGDVTTGQALVVDGTKLVFDDIEGTTYSAGSGLSLSGTEFSVDAITASGIADEAITTSKIANDAVTTAKIQDASITGAKLATGTITGANIADGAIDSTNIASASIGLNRLAIPSGATSGQALVYDGTKLEFGDVEGTTYSAGSGLTLTGTTFSVDTIGTSNIADGAITSAKIGSGEVTSDDIEDGTIDSTDIGPSSISGTNIDLYTITGAKLATGTITGANIADGAIDSTNIASASIGVNRLFVPGDVTTGQALIVDGTKLVFDDIEGTTYSAGSGLSLSGTEFSVDAITASGIADEAITTSKIANDAVTTAKIQNASITGDKLASSFSYSGTLTATAFVGDGSGLTNISGGASGLDDLTDVANGGVNGNIMIGDGVELKTTPDVARGNIGIGESHFANLTFGDFNVAIGTDVGTALTTGGNNIAIGLYSLKSNQQSSNNIALGFNALQLYNATTAYHNNIALGQNSSGVLTSGIRNISIGDNALVNYGTGNRNIAIGASALGGVGMNNHGEYDGDRNVSIGVLSLGSLTSGTANVSVGHYAGRSVSSADSVVLLGSYSTAASGLSNAVAIGSGASVSSSNTIQLGNSSITDVITPGTVTANSTTLTSDKRLKKDIQPVEEASTLLASLQAYQYLKRRNLSTNDYDSEEFGLIAQEVQEILPFLVHEGGGEDKLLSLDYNSFIALLIKAHQEQQALVDEQAEQLEAQQRQMEAQSAQMSAMMDRLEQLERLLLQDQEDQNGDQGQEDQTRDPNQAVQNNQGQE